MSLADAITYEASFQVWKASGDWNDDPSWRETWAMRSPEDCVALAQKHVAEAATRAAARRRPSGYLKAKREW